MDCQTPGALYHTTIEPRRVAVTVDIPFELEMSYDDTVRLERRLHDAVEELLAPYFANRRG